MGDKGAIPTFQEVLARALDENRHFVRCFLEGRQPELDFDAGLEVMELLMTAYMSAEQERTIAFKPDNLAAFVPAVAQGTWRP